MTTRAHHMPFGANMAENGTAFALWAPSGGSVELMLDGRALAMAAGADGWRRLTVPGAAAGSRYGFRIDGGAVVPDPASRFQPEDVHALSQVVDPRSYDWQDGAWSGRPWQETVLYEVHVGAATAEGTFRALQDKLPALAELGITAVELMPLSDFDGARNWGYDGVLPFAPDASYGTPDDLKRLVDRAHALGVMIFIDVVYNHFGPTGNYLSSYAKSFFTERHQTPWGAAINFDGDDARPVRDFFIHNALYWIEEFHVDGLRFDAVDAIRDDSRPHILAEIAERVRDATPDRHVHLVLENERNQSRWLRRALDDRRKLYDAQWDDDLHHAWHVALTGERKGYYVDFADDPLEHLGRALAEGFVYQGEPSPYKNGEPRGEPSSHLAPTAFVGFIQNHDQVGNRALGERLTVLTDAPKLALAHAALLLSPQVPMLFMGEEWGAATPFLYFVDFADDPKLQQAVRDGRREEFAHFFGDYVGEHASRVPDPTAEDTFLKSKLDWDEAARSPHAEVRAAIGALLELRRREILPLIATPFLGAMRAHPTPDALDVTWRFEGGVLRLSANFGNVAVEYRVAAGDRLVWASADAAVAGATATLPPWTGALFRGAA